MKPRLTKEMVDSVEGDMQGGVCITPYLSEELCHYARVAIHLEEYNNELFRMIEKILEKK